MARKACTLLLLVSLLGFRGCTMCNTVRLCRLKEIIDKKWKTSFQAGWTNGNEILGESLCSPSLHTLPRVLVSSKKSEVKHERIELAEEVGRVCVCVYVSLSSTFVLHT